jgi:molybdopterin synthase sulfur carrier subunit
MKIIYSAWFKDAVGCEEEEITLPDGVRNVGQLIDWLAGRGPRYESAFEFVEVIKVVVNKVLVRNDHSVSDDDEVTFVPPIGGG